MSITAYEDIKNACAEAIKSMRATSSITKGNNNNNSASQSNVGLNILLDSAHEYYVKGEYKKADIFFERVLEIEPNHIETLNGRGILLYRLADYDKARNCFEKVLQVDPKNIVALNSIEILGKKKDDTRQQIEEGLGKKKDDTRQQIERPAPSLDSGTIPRADPRNPYNDPTLPYYNPDLGKKKDDTRQQIE
jgi:tetratricopeptide (TPR) repeat protein